MNWVTRPGCHIDRAACAWLIRRYIDPEATFVFVEDPSDAPSDAIPFDMRGVALSHHGGDCSFETFLKHYHLDDPVLWDIAHIVHEADLHDERYDAPEAVGLDVLLQGLVLVRGDPDVLLLAEVLFDGLYAYRKQAVSQGTLRSV
ncbi:MAG: chromate resistance protein ChrB domain-containing protein [Dehalococcoidia bacterium]